MVKIVNCSPSTFKKYTLRKNIYIFGAGTALESCFDIYCQGHDVEGVADNGVKMLGDIVTHNGKDISVMSCEDLIKDICCKGRINDSIILISTPFYAFEIISQLDSYSEIDGIEVFSQILMRNMFERAEDFYFSSGKAVIPKVIHYVWVGGKVLPDEYKKNIEGWHILNPDYDIVEWNENNLDFEKCDYAKEAYELNEWGFFSNYVRLDVIRKHGGIYLDTDVVVHKNMDCLLNDTAFFNMGNMDRINMGCGFGAVPNHSIIREIMQNFESRHFIGENGKPDKRAFHLYVHSVLRRYGFTIDNKYQNANGVALYPMEVMSPLTLKGMRDGMSEKTLSKHLETGTWKNKKEQEGIEKLLTLLPRVYSIR